MASERYFSLGEKEKKKEEELERDERQKGWFPTSESSTESGRADKRFHRA